MKLFSIFWDLKSPTDNRVPGSLFQSPVDVAHLSHLRGDRAGRNPYYFDPLGGTEYQDHARAAQPMYLLIDLAVGGRWPKLIAKGDPPTLAGWQ
jgi:hypothetical protein